MKLTIRCLLTGLVLSALCACETSQPLQFTGKVAGQFATCGDLPPDITPGTVSYCEPRDYPDLSTSGTAKLRSTNGFAYVAGAGRSTITLTALVQTRAATEARAKEIASQVVINTGNDDFFATGPKVQPPEFWGVHFDAQTPARMNLDTTANNGELRLTGLEGKLSASAVNGNVTLEALAGAVTANSTNGNTVLMALAGSVTANSSNGNIEMLAAGSTWSGDGLTAEATNGFVRFNVASDYSARFTLDAENGTTSSDFEGGTTTMPDPAHSHYEVTLGKGGALLKGSAHNGNAELRHR